MMRNNLAKKFSRKIESLFQNSSAGPKIDLQSDDIFIVSYPKSGNTWVRFLLANLLKEKDEDEVNFITIRTYIPELGKDDAVIAKMSPPRIIKSHNTYSDNFSQVIYIIRDARDAYVSLYHYTKHRHPQNMNFAEFLRNIKIYWPYLWSEHVNSWLSPSKQSNLLLTRYEDLAINCTQEVKRMAAFIGMTVTDQNIAKAVTLSSFDKMQKLEKKGRSYKDKAPVQFVRKGQPGNWETYFGDQEREALPKEDKETLVRLGYTDSSEW